jgi:predicted  nucleic acid-binding Zn-ribbon protein
MTEKDQHLIDELKLNIRRLINSLEDSRNELEKIRNENKNLLSDIVADREKFEELKKRYENLKVAKAMAEGDPENQAAKQKITKLIREVDKCIALLNH